ncbi:hypothetical protein B0H10DRAFT_896834 [Mycena sp. CBHHK59/15]|nr:hypothetical protein B0H10DRAFT_896834 [Mycena sp. CBHHK59/15]
MADTDDDILSFSQSSYAGSQEWTVYDSGTGPDIPKANDDDDEKGDSTGRSTPMPVDNYDADTDVEDNEEHTDTEDDEDDICLSQRTEKSLILYDPVPILIRYSTAPSRRLPSTNKSRSTRTPTTRGARSPPPGRSRAAHAGAHGAILLHPVLVCGTDVRHADQLGYLFLDYLRVSRSEDLSNALTGRERTKTSLRKVPRTIPHTCAYVEWNRRIDKGFTVTGRRNVKSMGPPCVSVYFSPDIFLSLFQSHLLHGFPAD